MKYLRLILPMTLSLCLSSCFQTELNAPEGKEVRIISHEDPVTFTDEYKNFYILGGLIPVWTTQPEEIIEKENLVEVRVRTRDTISDSVITLLSMLLPILIFPQHVIVEGNRTPEIEGVCSEAGATNACVKGGAAEH